jgi:hypothetical protein
MTLSKFEILKLFKDNLVQFLDALIEKLPQEKDLIILRILFAEQIPIEQALQIFSSRILPYEKMVTESDQRFFLECQDLFEGIRSSKVNYFKDLWTSPTFTDDDRTELWKWFKLFLKIAKLYKNL